MILTVPVLIYVMVVLSVFKKNMYSTSSKVVKKFLLSQLYFGEQKIHELFLLIKKYVSYVDQMKLYLIN